MVPIRLGKDPGCGQGQAIGDGRHGICCFGAGIWTQRLHLRLHCCQQRRAADQHNPLHPVRRNTGLCQRFRRAGADGCSLFRQGPVHIFCGQRHGQAALQQFQVDRGCAICSVGPDFTAFNGKGQLVTQLVLQNRNQTRQLVRLRCIGFQVLV